MSKFLYTILIQGYNIAKGTFERNLDSDSGQTETFDTLFEARKTVVDMLQYKPRSSEYDIRFANDTIPILTILKKMEYGNWKPTDSKVYVSSYDESYLPKIRRHMKGKAVVTVQRRVATARTVLQEELPLTLNLAAEIQKGEKQGCITKKYGKDTWRLVQVVGSGEYILENADRLKDKEYETVPFNTDTAKAFTVHVTRQLPPLPANLIGKPSFDYGGLTVIPAGTFTDYGVKSDFEDISRHLFHAESKPLLPDWNYEKFYQSAKKAKDNDIFWVVEKGEYLCPGNMPFIFLQ